ncbi:MAG: hypothetical protein MJZ81_09260 [Bacteroidales bacterium]|nr:hypothetical protein [Bacteroidales bacterium]
MNSFKIEHEVQGTSIEFTPCSASRYDEGCLSVELENLLDTSDDLSFPLYPVEVGEFIQVLRGITDEKRFVDECDGDIVSFSIKHVYGDAKEPDMGIGCYHISISESEDGILKKELCFDLNTSEAFALSIAIEQKLGSIMFGD